MFNRLPELRSFEHIAIIQTAFLGDVALSLPLAQAINDHCDTTQITYVTTPAGATLVNCMSGVDNVISYDKRGLQSGKRGIKLIAELLREKKVDCIIAPHRSLRTSLISYFAKPVYSVGFNKNTLSILYKKRVKYYDHLHEIYRNLQLLSAFAGTEGILDSIPDVKLSIDDEDSMFIESRLANLGIANDDVVVAIAPGSVWATKKWIDTYFIELAILLRKAGIKPILIGSKDDKKLCDKIADVSGCLSIAGETSIPQTLHLLKRAKLTVTNDSAPTHFAGLVKCPTIAIFGATSPIFGFGPSGEYDRMIQIEELECKPCRIHGSNQCPTGTYDCMNMIKPADVFNDCIDVIQETSMKIIPNKVV